MADTPPRYLTDPGWGLSERQATEERFRRVFRRVLPDPPTESLTAASPRLTATIGEAMRILEMPEWMRGWMLSGPEDPDADTMARLTATVAYNRRVLKELAEWEIPYKMWVTRHDNLVRPTHVEVDGTRIPLSQPFVVGGALVQVPGDPRTAPPEIWRNCRCYCIGKYER